MSKLKCSNYYLRRTFANILFSIFLILDLLIPPALRINFLIHQLLVLLLPNCGGRNGVFLQKLVKSQFLIRRTVGSTEFRTPICTSLKKNYLV
jgi:hypothetical protein